VLVGMSGYHLAQLNIATPAVPVDGPVFAEFMALLPEVNALAEHSPGFVWRLTAEDSHDATSLRPYGPDIMVNMSVWESVEALREFTYRSAHLEPMRRRREWFTAPDGPYLVLWWVSAGHRPGFDEAKARLDLLIAGGPGPAAFTLRETYPAPDAAGTAPDPAGAAAR
jgi:heme-degrading monooxygenase HmoA